MENGHEKCLHRENGADFEKQVESPLDSFRKLNAAMACAIPDELPPMAAGLIGYMSYDAVRLIENTVPDTNPDTCDIPLGMFMRPTIMVIFDSVTGTIYIVSPVLFSDKISSDVAYENASKRISSIKQKLQSSSQKSMDTNLNQASKNVDISFSSNMDKQGFKDMVEKARDYIKAGDIFQVVPSQRFESDFDFPPFSFYRSLRHLNPSPFYFFLQFDDFQLVGSVRNYGPSKG